MFRTVEFQSTFENEWQFDANDNPVAPGARELAEAVAREIGKRADIMTPVEQHSFYGWAFDVSFGRCRFVNVLNPADDFCFLTVRLPWYWLRTLLLQRPRRKFDKYVLLLSETLATMPQVSRIVWQEYRH